MPIRDIRDLPDFPDYPPQTPKPNPNNIRPGSSGRGRVPQDDEIEAGDGKILPIVYGRAYLQPKTGMAYATGGGLFTTFFYCTGEIEEIEAVYLKNLGDDDTNVWAAGAHGSSITHNQFLTLTQYHGTTTQTADSTIVALIPSYTDTNIYTESNMNVGQVYIVSRQYSLNWDGVPYPEIIVKGLNNIWDPRLLSGVGDYAYTDNMALAFADFMDKDYGANQTVDWDSVEVVADMNDELVVGRRRFWGGVVLEEPKSINEHIERFRAISGCMVRMEGSTVYFVPNRPAASVFTFDTSNIVKGSFTSKYKDQTTLPSRVVVKYTDTTRVPWSVKDDAYYEDPAVAAGTRNRSTTTVDLTDCQSRAVANRYAIEQYRELNFQPWEVNFESVDVAAPYVQGDVITITHPYIGTGATFRIIKSSESKGQRQSKYRIQAQEYDAGVYSDDDVADTPITDPTLTDPTTPDPVTAGTVTETVVADEAGKIISRLEINFTPVDWPYVKNYRIRIVGTGYIKDFFANQSAGEDVFVASDDISTYVNSNLGEIFTISIYTVGSINDNESTAYELSLTVKGKYRRPPDVTGLTAVFENGVLTLNWEPVIDIGVVRYRVRFAVTDTGWGAAAAAHKGLLTDTSFTMREFPADDDDKLWFYVIAKDDVGKGSLNAAKIKVIIDNAQDDNWKTVAKTIYADNITTISSSMEIDFVYGDAEYFASNMSTHTLANRIGASGAWDNVADEWYKHHPTFVAQFVGCESPETDFDLGSDRMAIMSAQGDHFVGGAVDPIVQSVHAFSTSLATRPPNASSTTGYFLAVMDRMWISYYAHGSDFNDAVNDYWEQKFPIVLKSRQVDSIQGGTITGLDETDLDYQLNFSPRYLNTPRFQFHIVCTDVSVIIGIKDLSSVRATLHKIAGSATFSWGVSWNSIGQ